MNWSVLHSHYTHIKLVYNLTSTDILRQLSLRCSHANLKYLSPSGVNQNPSTKIGTVGRNLRDALNLHMTKIDWVSSAMTYEDKLTEMIINNGSRHIYVDVIKNDPIPKLDITINLSEGPKLSKEELICRFTIDLVVPEITTISYSRYLIEADMLYFDNLYPR